MELSLITIFGPNVIMFANILGVCVAYLVAAIRCLMKKEVGYKYILPVIVVMMTMAVWMYEPTKNSLLPSCIQLLLAVTLPEIIALLKDHSYQPSLKASTSMFTLSILGWIGVFPIWKAQEEANLGSALIMLLFLTIAVSGFFLFMSLTARWEIDKKTKT